MRGSQKWYLAWRARACRKCPHLGYVAVGVPPLCGGEHILPFWSFFLLLIVTIVDTGGRSVCLCVRCAGTSVSSGSVN